MNGVELWSVPGAETAQARARPGGRRQYGVHTPTAVTLSSADMYGDTFTVYDARSGRIVRRVGGRGHTAWAAGSQSRRLASSRWGT